MRKVMLAMFMSLDGYIEGPGGALVPPAWSNDLERHWSGANLAMAGAVLYGRRCYEGMAAYWTSPAADPKIAGRLAGLPKYVASSTLRETAWSNSTIIDGDLSDAIRQLKAEPGGDIVAFGGAGLAASLLERGLVDELRLMVTPALFGGGKRMFSGGYDQAELRLLDARTMDTGAVILHYALRVA